MEQNTENNRIEEIPQSGTNSQPDAVLSELEGIKGKEETEKTDVKQKSHLYKKGQSGNPNGRPPGTKNFSTLFEKAIKKIAESTNQKEIDIEADLVLRAINEAKKGKYQYHKDIFDRVYGQAVQKIESKTEMEINLSDEQKEKLSKMFGL